VAAVSAFAVILLVALGAYVLLRGREKRAVVATREATFSGTAAAGVAQAWPGLPSGPAAQLFVRIIQSLGKHIRPKKREEISLLQKRFLRAGLRSRSALATFFGAKALCALCLSMGFAAAVALFRLQVSVLGTMLPVIGLALAGFCVPNLWLSLRTSRRQDEFLRSFPDALDLLVVCAEAGMGLDAAMKRVGDEMQFSSKVLSDELALLSLEMRAGKERRDAMRSLADRLDLDDVNSWVTLLIQTDKFGTSIAQALRVHSDLMRTKRAQRVEELAAKLPVKLLFPTILCIFPSLFLVIMGPAVVRIWRMLSGG
jgi:tight adherence protein C